MNQQAVPGVDEVIETALTGVDLINQPLLNKGTAFTEDERHDFRLHGVLPPNVGTLAEQVTRRLAVLRSFRTDFERYAFLRDLQDANETLFYALLVGNIEELLPLVYTPTVGEGCQRFSEIWRKPRGLFLSYPNKHRIREILSDPRFDRVRVIVVSDGERILGLGDQGAGGMGISIGKLSLYTACAGIHPAATLPIFLDLGTNNEERLANPLYVGWRNARIGGAEYDAFIEEFVSAVAERFPKVLLQWEDFAGTNAGRLLERYRDRLCTFNDDIQGTAAVAAGTLQAAIQVTGVPLIQQRIAIVGAGAAGAGIAGLLVKAMVEQGLSETDARRRFYVLDSKGLVAHGLREVSGDRGAFAQPQAAVADWKLEKAGEIGLLDVMNNAKPTALIGVSGQAGAFTEAAIRAMAKHVARPIIFPLSNPTSRSEATPEHLVEWTQGRALIGTGSPFPPVAFGGKMLPINQTNNSYIFPGVGLAVLAVDARRVTDTMFMAAGKALAELSPAKNDPHARLLPPVDQLRAVSVSVAIAVGRQAMADGVAERIDDATLEKRIRAQVWEPVYRRYRPASVMVTMLENYDAIFRGVGKCLLNWSEIEHRCCDLFLELVDAAPGHSPLRAAFDEVQSFTTRLSMIKTAFAVVTRSKSLNTAWVSLEENIRKAYRKRNDVAHFGVVVYGSGKSVIPQLKLSPYITRTARGQVKQVQRLSARDLEERAIELCDTALLLAAFANSIRTLRGRPALSVPPKGDLPGLTGTGSPQRSQTPKAPSSPRAAPRKKSQ